MKWCGLVGSVLWLVGTLAAVAATFSGVSRQPVQLQLVDGTPIQGVLYRSRSSDQPAPAVVVLHGTALTHASCAPGLSVPLARNGLVALAIDLRGHGHSGGSVPRKEYDHLQTMLGSLADHPEVDTAIEFLKTQPFVDAKRLALVGHSRGGWAAASVAYRRQDIACVVSINSAPTTVDPTRPRNFLLLAGGLDEVIPLKDCLAAIERAMGDKWRPDVSYIEHHLGAARQLVVADWANHLSQLADPSTTRRAVQWIGYSFGRDPGVVPGDRLLIAVWAALLASLGSLAASASLLEMLARQLLPHPPLARRNRSYLRVVFLLFILLFAAPVSTFLAESISIGPVLFAEHAVMQMLVLSILSFGAGLTTGAKGKEEGLASGGPSARHAAAARRALGPPLAYLLGLLGLALGGTFLALTWGTTWLDLVPSLPRAVLGLVLFPLLFPCSFGLAHAMQRVLCTPAATWRHAALRGSIWLMIPVALWLGHFLFVMEQRPFLGIPVSLLTPGFLAATPLWLLPDRPGMSVARAVSHAGVTAWLLACHLPFTHSG